MSSPTSAENDPPPRISPLLPAGVLEKAGIKLCIVWTAAVQLFGSDLVLADLDLAIDDQQFNLALSLLHDQGFHDIDFDNWHRTIMPVLGKPGGWVACRLQFPQSSDFVVLSPASCWHLDINLDTTFLPYADPYRFPCFLSYLEALIRTLDALVRIGDHYIVIEYLYSIMVRLLGRRPELREKISPEDQFFIDFYEKQNKRAGQLRVLELRRSIMEGAISVEAAQGRVPRPDLLRKRFKEMMERQEKDRMAKRVIPTT